MIERLAAFFRNTLEVGSEKEIPLAKELDLASSYLEIERLRFGDRLSYMVEAEAGADSTPVPPPLAPTPGGECRATRNLPTAGGRLGEDPGHSLCWRPSAFG